jgi:hypothetical protein
MSGAGIIYEILRDRVIVLNHKGEFIFIRKDSSMNIGQVVKYGESDICAPKKGFFRYIPVAAGIAAALMFVMFFAGLFNKGKPENVYGFISIDINPSIELAFDSKYTVLETNALNHDGIEVMEGLQIKGHTVYNAVSEVVEKSKSLNYIDKSKKNTVLISVALNEKSKEYISNSEKEEKKLDEILDNINKEIEQLGHRDNLNIANETLKVTSEVRKEAQKHDSSMGKYYLFLKAKEQGVDIEIEELSKVRVSELIEKAGLSNKAAQTSVSTPAPGYSSTVVAENTANPLPAVSHSTPVPKSSPTKAQTTGEKTVKFTATPVPAYTPEYTLKPVQSHTHVPEPVPSASASGKVKIMINCNGSLKKSQGILVEFFIVNTGKTSLNLADLKVRYYFTKEGASPVKFMVYCNQGSYGAQVGGMSDVHATYYTLPKAAGADSYMEITFDGGIIPPGENTMVKGDIVKEDWSYFDLVNDYSFNPEGNSRDYIEWNKMTAYISDTLVWGIEPGN